MKVCILTGNQAGTEVDLPNVEAQNLVATGFAKLVLPPTAEEKAAAKAAEKAAEAEAAVAKKASAKTAKKPAAKKKVRR